jgi:hypothetical protein
MLNVLDGFLFIVFIVQFEFYSSNSIQKRANDQLRYTVGLSEPLQSTLQWDIDANSNQTKLIFQWNITLANGYSGLLALSTYDLNTNNLDVLIFTTEKQLYNGFTDHESILSIPETKTPLDYIVKNRIEIENGRLQAYTIEIRRPLNTCDEKQRNYIIDRGTTHLLTGILTSDDLRLIRNKQSVKMDVKRMNLTLQRVQLLKSQVG